MIPTATHKIFNSVLVASAALLALSSCSRRSGEAPRQTPNPLEVQFETRTELRVGSTGVADATLCDLNGDGQHDLAVTTLEGKLQVLLGNGAGDFTLQQSIDAKGFPFNHECADFDRDGDDDLIVLRTATSLVSVHLNDGQGNFTNRVNFTVPDDGDGIVPTDVNGDGVLDLVISHLRSSDLSVWLGNGFGGFDAAPGLAMPTGTVAVEPIGIVAADINADGTDDILCADNANQQIAIFEKLPAEPGYRAPYTFGVGAQPVALSVADLNGDSQADIVVSNRGTQDVTILERLGNGFRSSSVAIDGGPSTNLIADVTGDGLQDLIVCVFGAAAVTVIPGLPDGTRGEAFELPSSGLPYRPVVGDVNGDGHTDLLVTGSGTDIVNLYFGTGSGLASGTNVSAGIASPRFVTAADFDGDGRDEVAVSGPPSSQVAILGLPNDLNDLGLRAVQPTMLVEVGLPVLRVVRGDFDADGRPDLAAATERGLKLLLNRPGGDMGAVRFDVFPGGNQVLLPSAGSQFDVAVADMNGDGLDDIIASDFTAETVTVLRAITPALQYESQPVSIDIGRRPAGIAVTDLDADGDLDVAVARNASSNVAVLRNDGAGNLSDWLVLPVGSSPNYVVSHDFDEDGRMDVATSNAGDDSVTVLFGRVGGFIPVVLPAGDAPTGLLVGDFDGDGLSDLLTASLSSTEFRVLTGDGRGGFAPPKVFPGTYEATSVAFADLDGDRRGELVVASSGTRRVSVYRNLSR